MCDNNHEQLFVYSFSLPIILVVGVLFYEKHYEISRMRIEYFEKWLYHSNTRRLFTQDAKKSNPRQKKKIPRLFYKRQQRRALGSRYVT